LIYYLWSVERVCMILGKDNLGGKDWYGWGSDILVGSQEADGTWKGAEFGTFGADTCFALLFLQRANLAVDLTAKIKKKLAELKAGPVPGVRVGDTSGPPKKAINESTEGGKMAIRLVEAAEKDQKKLLAQFKDAKGVVYTEALTEAIPHMEGAMKSEARVALAARLTRMKADTLADYLKDEEAELRRAAALAAAQKEPPAKQLIPNLLPLLKDPDKDVPPAVRASLRAMTGQDYGTDFRAWQEWWNRQKN
jgi:hypothetical protein